MESKLVQTFANSRTRIRKHDSGSGDLRSRRDADTQTDRRTDRRQHRGHIGCAIAVQKFQENWIQYRAVAEALKHEKYLFLAQSAQYAPGDRFHTLVNRVEALTSQENTAWTSNLGQKTKEKDR